MYFTIYMEFHGQSFKFTDIPFRTNDIHENNNVIIIM